MRLLRHDFRDLKLAFALSFDLRRVMYAGLALCWTVLVIGVVLAVLSARAYGQAFSPEGLFLVFDTLGSTPVTPARALMFGCILTGWWIGFGWLTAPVMRSAAVDIARDERERRASIPVLNRQAAFAPLLGLCVAAVALLLALLWSLIAMIPGAAGAVLAGMLLPLVLIAAVFAGAVTIVVLVSAPMMGPTAVVEGRDYFEALTRPMSYAMQQPGRYLCYQGGKLLTVVVSALLGAAALAIGWALIVAALWIVGEWSLVQSAWHEASGRGEGARDVRVLAMLVAGLFWGSVGLLATWLMTVCLCTDLIVYLLMRYRVDGVTFDAIAIAEDKLKIYPRATETAEQAEAARKRFDEQQATGEKVKVEG